MNLSIQISKTTMKCPKILSRLNENDNNLSLHEIAFWILKKKLVDMGLCVEIFFD
jgi:hypothetical protein